MSSHAIDYQIKGESIQIVEVELDPLETVIAEAGAMLFMEEGIQFEARMGDGSTANQGLFDKLLSAGSRVLTGESLFMTHFTNRGNKKAKVGFSAPYPGTVIPIDLATSRNNELVVQKDGFLCAAFGTKLSIVFNRKIGAGLVGGEGFILQKLQGELVKLQRHFIECNDKILIILEGRDASENETTREMRFDDARWYRVRLTVTATHIRAWLDDDPIVEVATAGRRIGIRPELDVSRPLGIASYRTRAGVRAIRVRAL